METLVLYLLPEKVFRLELLYVPIEEVIGIFKRVPIFFENTKRRGSSCWVRSLCLLYREKD